MPRLNPTTTPQVSITLRMSEEAHKRLLLECGHCMCNVSSFVRSAVMKEIAIRQTRRNEEAYLESVAKAIEIEEGRNAQVNP